MNHHKILTGILALFLTLPLLAQDAAQGAATQENMLLLLTIVTGIVVIAAVYIVLKAVTTLSGELRKQANRKNA
ncbi:MAG TPA: hypothetical protein PK239_03105 [Chitinophagales bacterium]|nr:hypothetical protein [Chitinophagales bacterium]HRK26258.1 hypothetical protein [Chitinophagales bacterium]